MLAADSITGWLEGWLGTGLLFHAVAGILIVLLALVSGKIVKFLLDTVGRKIITKTENDLDDKILAIVLGRLMSVAAITGFYFGLHELSDGVEAANTGYFRFLEYANGALFLLMALVLTAVAIRITDTLIRHALHRIAERGMNTFDQTLAPLINRVTNILIALVAVIVVLDHFGQNVSTLLVSLGVGSLAIALAAQDTLSNMIAGFVIMLDRPFRRGDRVKLPTGEEGDIFEIGVRSTKILDFDNNLLIVPNNELIKTRIINASYPDAQARVVVEVTTAYGTEVRRVKEILLRLAASHPDVLRDPPPQVYLTKLGDFALEFKLFCRVHSFSKQFTTTETLRVAAYEALQRAMIEIPFPQQVVHLKDGNQRNGLPASRKRKSLPR